jgi:hypothetical protein
MWRLHGQTRDERAAAARIVKDGFEGLRGRIPGLHSLEVGIDSSGADHACDVVLVSDFESRGALDAYATHPEHERLKAALDGVRTARFLVDYEVEPPGRQARAI